MQKNMQIEYRAPLASLRQRLTAEVQSMEEGIREDIVVPGEHAPSAMHPGDQDAEGLHEKLTIAQNEEMMLEQVEEALERIESGTFGVCQDCGRDISRRRLDAIPYTPWCIECARSHDRETTPA